MNSKLLLGAALAAAYLFRDKLMALIPGAQQPDSPAAVAVPPAAPTQSLIKAAAAYPEFAARLGDQVQLTADEWAYYYSQVTGAPAPEVYDVNNRAERITASEFHERRTAAGLLSGLRRAC